MLMIMFLIKWKVKPIFFTGIDDFSRGATRQTSFQLGRRT